MVFTAVSGILTFVLLGIVQSLYGPLLPGLARAFALEAATVGFVFTAHGLGALLGVLLPSLLSGRALAGYWLGIASALILLGAAAVAMATSWPAVLVAVFVLAIGLGIHVVRLNALFVSAFWERGMTMSLLLNAGFSVGAILGPVVVGLTGELSRELFGVVALLALALLPVSVLTDKRARALAAASTERAPGPAAGAESRLGSPLLLAAFVALMCLTTGVENSISGWMATVALAQGYSFSSAANLTALFFGGIFKIKLLIGSCDEVESNRFAGSLQVGEFEQGRCETVLTCKHAIDAIFQLGEFRGALSIGLLFLFLCLLIDQVNNHNLCVLAGSAGRFQAFHLQCAVLIIDRQREKQNGKRKDTNKKISATVHFHGVIISRFEW